MFPRDVDLEFSCNAINMTKEESFVAASGEKMRCSKKEEKRCLDIFFESFSLCVAEEKGVRS